VSWFDDFLAQALLVNMHEYFAGQIIFQLHPLCDAQFYLRQATVANPFQLKNVTDNIEYLEFTSPSNILHPSQLDFYSDNPTIVYVTKTQLDVVFYLTKITGQHLKDLMSRPGNTVYQRHIKIDFKVDVDQCVIMLKNIYRFTISNQKSKDVPYLCRKFYSLGPCTLESGIHYLELVQASLHRHKYTFFTDHRCDVVQLVSCLYPGHLKNQHHQATQKEEYSWTELKRLADEIVASLKASRMQCYDSLPGG
jgi:hypothetical protein